MLIPTFEVHSQVKAHYLWVAHKCHVDDMVAYGLDLLKAFCCRPQTSLMQDGDTGA